MSLLNITDPSREKESLETRKRIRGETKIDDGLWRGWLLVFFSVVATRKLQVRKYGQRHVRRHRSCGQSSSSSPFKQTTWQNQFENSFLFHSGEFAAVNNSKPIFFFKQKLVDLKYKGKLCGILVDYLIYTLDLLSVWRAISSRSDTDKL